MKKNLKYVNGQILSEQKGLFTHSYFENGAIKEVGIIENGLADGKWKYYRKSGKLWQTGSFDAGVKIGLWERYNSKGEITFSKNLDKR